ncbi:ral guanine nucleotide dissociation stimulator-like 1 [Anguilla rostrata]|uniref:ral guanine nucleotide dissociation stimulator-like 1 n=1 Tax=Anguilla rostrata TaxID=7938 RepID=UPI0030D60BF9
MGKKELTMDPVQEWGEEVEDGAVFGVTLRREPVGSAPAAGPAPGPGPGPAPGPAETQSELGFVQYRTCKVRRLKAATLPRLVAHLLDPACQEPDYCHVFLSTYRAFTSTSALIKLLFQSDGEASDLDNGQFHKSPLSSLILAWLEKHSQDFWEPPQYPSLRLLSFHLRRNLGYRRLAQRADALLKKLKHEETNSHEQSAPVHQVGEEEEESEDEGLLSKTVDDTADFMDFPAADVAEELTRLDAELFRKVVPFQCVGCQWSQRDKNESLCPSVRATIAQFNAITNRVITSLLCRPVRNQAPPSPRGPPPGPTQRARIIEKWITVAQECRRLRNFSSLKAVLSALQSNAIYRLRKTWASVCRDSVASFEHLCETFPDENCVLTSREILVEDGSQPAMGSSSPKMPKCSPISQQLSLPGGVVPYLGTYLTVLTMLDTALPDNMEGGLINFEKRRREFEILSQIEQLQASCSQYTMPPRANIGSWLLRPKLLTDQESYELSRELEPPVDFCPSSPVSWSQRLLARKLASLMPVGEGPGRKTYPDQISVTSSGSSGSEMEDLSIPNSSPLGLKALSSSCHNMAEAFSPGPFPDSAPFKPASGSQKDLSVTSPGPARRTLCPAPQHKRSVSMLSLPVYNQQVADSCIIRVSVECGNNGNMYKSILVTSQDKTAQVIQRALEKHSLGTCRAHEFTLSQVLSHDRELLIPDKANVFYAMCTTANYDFILRQRRNCRRKAFDYTATLGPLTSTYHTK